MNREEAIKVLNSRPYVGEVREAIETLIPELRESEDERIRKTLINALKTSKSVGELKFVLPEPTREECITYLEKQKEASKAIEAVERIDKFIDEYLANAHDMKDSDPDKKYYLGWDAALGKMSGILQDVYSDEKQKEQKPAEVDESTKRLNDNWMKQHFDDYEEQKPAQSRKEILHQEEQDYSRLTDFERTIHRGFLAAGVENVPVGIIEDTAFECLGFLALNDDKSVEWDEYTKTNLGRALQIIKDAKGNLQGYQTDDGLYECDKAIECLEHFLYRGLEIEKPKQEWSEDYNEENIQTRFAFYTYKDEDGVLYLSNVFVEEASRNHGFGTRILRAAEKVAETIGATTISLKVKQDSPANAWYRKNGYGYVAFEDGYDWLEKNLEYMKPNKQEWSEEDTEMYINVASSLRGYACGLENKEHRKHIKKELDWLENRFKSLCPQPKEEWSEEDRINLNSVLNHLKEYLTNDAYTYYEKWLKSLRPQSKIHYWTEEEIEPIISDYLTGREHYGGMMSRLRCLKPKSHWKPSVKQMNTLLSVEGILRSLQYDDKAKILASIYEQLKQFYP